MTPHRILLATLVTSVACFASSSSLNASDPTGVWRGQWTSQSTGHRGPMRAVIRPNGQGGYTARFSGRFALVIPFMYRATMTPVVDAYGNSYLYSEKPLPFAGSYRMSTMVHGSSLSGSFQAAGDTGAVNMQRVR